MLCKKIQPVLAIFVGVGLASTFSALPIKANASESFSLEVTSQSDPTRASGPLLITDLPSSQVYNQQQLMQFEKNINSGEQLKGNLNGLEQDYLLYQQLLKIDPDKITEQQRGLLIELMQHEPRAYQSHDEGPVAIPVYNVKALAGSKFAEYQVSLQKPKLEKLLSTNITGFVETSTSDPSNNWAAKAVLENANSLPDSVIKQLIDGYSTSESYFSHSMLYEVMKVSGKKEAVMAVLDKSELYFQKHSLLENLNKYVSAQEQEKILHEIILKKDRFSSQALLKYAALPESVKQVELFYDLLSDPELGSSSASVLAESFNSGANHQRVVSMIKSNQSSRSIVANSLLALWLSESPSARATLRELLEGSHIPFEDMQEEVELWLN